MRRVMILICFSLLSVCIASGQSVEELACIMAATGVSDPEELDEEVVDRLTELMRKPLRLNLSSGTEILSTGLFSRYQMASVVDYRERSGDIMSLSEFAALDGIGQEFAVKVAPFLSFDSLDMAGSMTDDRSRLEVDAVAKSGLRHTEGAGRTVDWYYGIKTRVGEADRFSVSLACQRTYSSIAAYPSACSFNVYVPLKKLRGYVLAGDFNARFGQGLILWNGMSVNGLASPDTFVKNPVGLTGTWSFSASSANTGAGACFEIGRFRLSTMLCVPGIKDVFKHPDDVALLPAVNVGWFGRNGEVSFTHYAEFADFSASASSVRGFAVPEMKSSVDFRWCVRGVDVFSEVGYDWIHRAVAALAGTTFPLKDGVRLAAILRYYPAAFSFGYGGAVASVSKISNEYGVCLSGKFLLRGSGDLTNSGSFSVDAAHLPEPKKNDVGMGLQFKGIVQYGLAFKDFIKFALKASFRYRTWGEPVRTDLRMDFSMDYSCFIAALRFDALYCVSPSFAGYVEGGLKLSDFALYLRQGVFKADDWDDRIYVYERDAPGSFNVPALYGRGLWSAMVASWKVNKWLKLFLRASYTGYPLMEEAKRKPGRAELKFQMSVSF